MIAGALGGGIPGQEFRLATCIESVTRVAEAAPVSGSDEAAHSCHQTGVTSSVAEGMLAWQGPYNGT